METEFELLKEQLIVLQLQLTQEQLRRRNALVFRNKQAFNKLRTAILNSRELQNDYESLIRELDLADFFGLVAEINSPISQKMGFALLDVVYDSVDKILLPLEDGPNNEAHKRRFSEVLKKVFNNPIASALINSNPVTGVIGKVVDLASGFVDSVIDRSDGKGANKLKVVTKEVIAADRVEAFTKRLQKYEILYGDLAEALTNFRERLSHVKAGMRDNLEEYGNAYGQFLALLSLNKETPFIGLDEVFHLGDKGWDGLSVELLEGIATDDRIGAALRFATNMDSAETRLNTLRSQFGVGLIAFQAHFVAVLQRPIAEDWQDVNIDRGVLRDTLNEIQSLTERSGKLVA